MRTITITPVLNGWVVNIGCTVVVFEDIKKLCGEIQRYYKNPEGVEKEYQKNRKNKQTVAILPVPTQETRTATDIASNGTSAAREQRDNPVNSTWSFIDEG